MDTFPKMDLNADTQKAPSNTPTPSLQQAPKDSKMFIQDTADLHGGDSSPPWAPTEGD